MKLLTFGLALVAGALVTLQIGSTAKLKEAVGDTIPAVIASSMFGVVLLAAAMVVMQMPWPPLQRLASAPLSGWLGGIFGAFYALVTIALARQMGATTLIALIVAGQVVCSVLVDHFGVLGFETRTATVARLTGCGLLISGFVLVWKS